MIKLEPRLWYGWQMMPGYGDAPYFSPILIHAVERTVKRKTIEVKFLNALYAAGVQMMQKRLLVLFSAETYLIARIDPEISPERTAIISAMSSSWLRTCCPRVADEIGSCPDEELQTALRQVFRQTLDVS